MATPSKKAPGMNQFLDQFTQTTFGRKRHDSIVEDVCVCCGGEAKQFKDALSKKEYGISGMCQRCQDEVFG